MYILKLTEKKYFLRKISDNFNIRTQENLQIVLALLRNSSSYKVSLSFRNNCMSQNGDLSALIKLFILAK